MFETFNEPDESVAELEAQAAAVDAMLAETEGWDDPSEEDIDAFVRGDWDNSSISLSTIHDVSKQSRDKNGQWTAGAGSPLHAKIKEQSKAVKVASGDKIANVVNNRRGEVSQTDYDVIEESLTDDERDEMESWLAEQKKVNIDTLVNESKSDPSYDGDDDAYREHLESTYEDSEEFVAYLRRFWTDHQDRFRGDAGFADLPEQNTWFDTDDDESLFEFETKAGAKYFIHAADNFYADQSAIEITFCDADGEMNTTGAGNAHEVFGKVVPAVVAYVESKQPETVTFSAAEASRRRLYDRLVKTVGSVVEGYTAITVEPDADRRIYILTKNPDAARKALADANLTPMSLSMTIEDLSAAWWTPEGWPEIVSLSGGLFDGDAHPRGDAGRFTHKPIKAEHVKAAQRAFKAGKLKMERSEEPITSDASGAPIHHHVTLKGGERVHPDELHRLRIEDGETVLHHDEGLTFKEPDGDSKASTFSDALHKIASYTHKPHDPVTVVSRHGYSATRPRSEWIDHHADHDPDQSFSEWYDADGHEHTGRHVEHDGGATLASEEDTDRFFAAQTGGQGRLAFSGAIDATVDWEEVMRKVMSGGIPEFTDEEISAMEDVVDRIRADRRTAGKSLSAAWDESKHKRGKPENAGEFGPGGNKGGASPAAQPTPTFEPHDKSPLHSGQSFPKVPPHPEGEIGSMPGLSDKDRAIESRAKVRALTDYPELREKYLAANSARDPDGNVRSVCVNTDEWREHFDGYTGTNAAAVHEPASYLNKKFLGEMIKEQKGKGNNKLTIYAGGGGSGKGTAIGQFFTEADYPIRVDQVSDNFKKASELFDTAKENGYTPEYVFVDRPPADAYGGVVGRAVNLRKKGKHARTVPIDIAMKGNIEARKTAIEILKKRPDVTPFIIDNRDGGNRELIKDREKAIKYLEGRVAEEEAGVEHHKHAMKQSIAERHLSGEIDEDIARGLLGDREFETHRDAARGRQAGAGAAAGVSGPAP